jgi:hypothetical protein
MKTKYSRPIFVEFCLEIRPGLNIIQSTNEQMNLHNFIFCVNEFGLCLVLPSLHNGHIGYFFRINQWYIYEGKMYI